MLCRVCRTVFPSEIRNDGRMVPVGMAAAAAQLADTIVSEGGTGTSDGRSTDEEADAG